MFLLLLFIIIIIVILFYYFTPGFITIRTAVSFSALRTIIPITEREKKQYENSILKGKQDPLKQTPPAAIKCAFAHADG